MEKELAVKGLTLEKLNELKTTKMIARQIRSSVKFKKFFEELRKHGTMSKAARSAGFKPGVVYALKSSNAAFAALCEEAAAESGDSLEYEAFRRAVHGDVEDIYWQGQVVGQKVVKSDKLLDKLLTAAKKEKYGNHSKVDVNVNETHNINISLEQAKSELLEKLAKIQTDDIIEAEYEAITNESNR